MKKDEASTPTAVWVIATLCICMVTGLAIYSLLTFRPVPTEIRVDYNTVTIVLLTTVTVVFSICAIVLAILGVVGFRNLVKAAGQQAEEKALEGLEKAFGASGSATDWLELQIRDEDGHYRKFLEEQILKHVYDIMPIIIAKMEGGKSGLADGEPTDEGNVD